MSLPTVAEQLEEFASNIGASADDVFHVWFLNHASETLQQKFAVLRDKVAAQSESVFAIGLLNARINSLNSKRG